MQEYLLRYSDKCFISLTKYIARVGADCNADSVHKLRLTIKKLNVLIGLINYSEKLTSKRELKFIDHIYINSGQLRNKQVQLNLLNGYRDRIGDETDFIVKDLRKDLKVLKKKLRVKVNQINPFDIALLNLRIDSTIEVLSGSYMDLIPKTKVNEIKEQMNLIIRESLKDKDLHRIRILLKELIYLVSLINKGNTKLKINLTLVIQLKNLQQELGDWHDLKVLLEEVKRVTPTSKSFVEMIELDKKIMQENIVSKLIVLENLTIYK